MVQISTPWGDPLPGNGPPMRRFLSNYFDLLFDTEYELIFGFLHIPKPYCTILYCIEVYLSYLTLNNIVTLKSGLDVTQGH